MEVLYFKSQGITHFEICRLCQITKTTLTKYIRQYQSGGIEGLKNLGYTGQPSDLPNFLLNFYFREKCYLTSCTRTDTRSGYPNVRTG